MGGLIVFNIYECRLFKNYSVQSGKTKQEQTATKHFPFYLPLLKLPITKNGFSFKLNVRGNV